MASIQSHTFFIGLAHFRFVKPYFLYDASGRRYRPTVKGSTIGWNVSGQFISYNQFRKILSLLT